MSAHTGRARYATFPGQNGKIAFSACGATDCGVFAMNADGTTRRQLTHNPTSYLVCTRYGCFTSFGQDSSPRWSADGKKIVFSREVLPPDSEGRGNADLYSMNADGSGLAQLTSDRPKVDGGPAWSPDGTRIVFTRYDFTGADDSLDVMNADGTGVRWIATGGGAPDWSPDGSTIGYARFHTNGFGPFVGWADLDLIDPDGTNERAVVATVEGQGDLFGFHNPSWAPDGTRIALDRVAVPFPCCTTGDYSIRVMRADGSGDTSLTSDGPQGDNFNPAFSPDGTKIAFTNGDCCGNTGRIWVMNADGSGKTDLAEGASPDWQPLVGPRRADYKNAAQFCGAERTFRGADEFRQKYGGGATAYGKCVSAK